MSGSAPARRTVGTTGEESAVAYLQRMGCEIIGRNVRLGHDEIDIVVRDGDDLVFVEVKSRRGRFAGAPEESVTPVKQERLRRASEAFVARARLVDVSCRFDVVTVRFADGTIVVNHIRNAF